jgi:TRAP-type C4-dicarboxylate transport system substrate-binding protein
MKRSAWCLVGILVIFACVLAPARAKEIKLVVTTMSPPGSDNITKFFAPWAERINQQANGSITLDLRAGVTLADHKNVYERVMDDVVQIGWVLHGEVGGRFPRTEVTNLPFLAQNAEESSIALWRLYASGALDAEYAEIVPLFFHLQPQSQLHFVKRPEQLTSLQGLRIGASSRVPLEIVERLGGAPISVEPSSFYETLQHGTIDGILTAWAGNSIFKYSEVTNFHVEVNLGAASGMLFMAKKKFDALPPEARKALVDNSGERASRDFGRHLDSLQESQRALVAAAPGQTLVKLTPEQDAAWRAKIEPLIADWASSRPDGPAILARYRALVAQVQSELRAARLGNP